MVAIVFVIINSDLDSIFATKEVPAVTLGYYSTKSTAINSLYFLVPRINE